MGGPKDLPHRAARLGRCGRLTANRVVCRRRGLGQARECRSLLCVGRAARRPAPESVVLVAIHLSYGATTRIDFPTRSGRETRSAPRNTARRRAH